MMRPPPCVRVGIVVIKKTIRHAKPVATTVGQSVALDILVHHSHVTTTSLMNATEDSIALGALGLVIKKLSK